MLQLMLNILEEMTRGTQGLLKNNKSDLGFSQGFIVLETEPVPFLKDRKVSKLLFIPYQPNSLLSVHLSSKEVREWCAICCSEILCLSAFSDYSPANVSALFFDPHSRSVTLMIFHPKW